MTFKLHRTTPFVAAIALTIVAGAAPVVAQDAKNAEKAAADAAREAQRKIDQFEEAAKAVGGPGGNPECVWIGRRVVGLLWRDDLATAFRHLDLYDRFGCPSGHVQAAFRCVIRQGSIDPKAEPDAPTSLNSRVHACWLDPQGAAKPPAPPAAATPPAAPPTTPPATPPTEKPAQPEKQPDNAGTEGKQ